MPQLKDDERFSTQTLRAKHQQALAAILQPHFAQRDAADWLAEFDRRGVPCAPVNSFADILADEHVAEMGIVHDIELPNGVHTPTLVYPVKLKGYSFETGVRPPRLGEHTEEVYAQWLT
jgi:crotonobetainyl-CoA:carnitine CoA-transferase CaiB-like acyl-CoA transferase